MTALLMTGFPGFLGSALLPRLLARREGVRAICLVQPQHMAAAHSRVREIEAAHPHTLQRVELMEGDITAPDLGIDPGVRDVLEEVNEVWHLAAIYDLTVAQGVAHRVNVDGTAQILAFCQSRPEFSRLRTSAPATSAGGTKESSRRMLSMKGRPSSTTTSPRSSKPRSSSARRWPTACRRRSTDLGWSSATPSRARPRSTTAPTSLRSSCGGSSSWPLSRLLATLTVSGHAWSPRDCDVVVATYDELTGFGLEDLAGKTVVTSAISDDRLAELASRGVDMVLDATPQPFHVTVVAALLEAMMLATVSGSGSLTNDDLLDMIVSAGLEPRVLYPNGRRRKSRFAFVIHPLSQEFFQSVEPLATITKVAPAPVIDVVEKALAYAPPFTYSHVTGIKSPTGAEAEGWLISVGGTPKKLMAHSPEFTYARLLAAAETARKLGAQVMGLGAFTKVVGDAGVTVAKQAPLPITTGNSYSASGALWAAHEALLQLGLTELDDQGRIKGKVMVVGATGAIGSVCARLRDHRCRAPAGSIGRRCGQASRCARGRVRQDPAARRGEDEGHRLADRRGLRLHGRDRRAGARRALRDLHCRPQHRVGEGQGDLQAGSQARDEIGHDLRHQRRLHRRGSRQDPCARVGAPDPDRGRGQLIRRDGGGRAGWSRHGGKRRPWTRP